MLINVYIGTPRVYDNYVGNAHYVSFDCVRGTQWSTGTKGTTGGEREYFSPGHIMHIAYHKCVIIKLQTLGS